MKIQLDKASEHTMGPLSSHEEILLRVLKKSEKDVISPTALRFELMSENDI